MNAMRSKSWAVAIEQLELVCPTVINLGREPSILSQQLAAERVGVQVPRTILSSSPKAALSAIKSDRVVIKALISHWVEPNPGLLYGAFPAIVERSAMESWEPFEFPVVFQEYVRHKDELRVYLVGDNVIGFLVGKSAASVIWTDEATVGVFRVSVDANVEIAARKIAAELSLEYGAFDFLLSDNGPVFLEVNVAGAWLWFEERAHLSSRLWCKCPRILRMVLGPRPVTQAAASLVIQNYSNRGGG